MASNWRKRLDAYIREAPDLTMKSVSLKAGLGASMLHDIIQRGRSPTIDNFISICEAIGVAPSRLLDGDQATKIFVPVVGIVSAGEGWTPIDDATHHPVEFELANRDTIALEVRGTSMAPVYRDGDYLICNRVFGPNVDNLIGQDCAVRTLAGEHFLKILRRGSRRGRFCLRSYNSSVEDVEDVAIAWAAPVSWIKRAG